ncbi:MAG: radical SAM protein [Desulfobacterales bacterium]
MTDSKTIPGQGYSRPVSDLRSFSARVNRLPRLIIELTDRCNNACQHCYINRPARDSRAMGREMSTRFIKNLILQAAELGCLDLRFTGGEPLLREDFSELYHFSRKNGFQVLFFTNARLVTPDLVRLFKKLPPGQPIGITVYGMSADTYDKVSGVKGAFEEFRRGVNLLRENHVAFALQMAVLADNRADVPAYEAWIRNLFDGRQKPSYIANFFQRARHDDPEKNRRIRDARGRAEEMVDLFSRADGYSTELRDFCRRFTGRKSDKLFECGFGQSISIDAYGFAQGCLLLRHPDLLYDLNAGTLKEAFFSFFPKFSDRRARHPLFLSRCAHCCLRGLCEQCPAQSWMEHGTLDTPVEFQCEIAHAHARKLGLLAAGEKGWQVTDWHSRLEQVK